MFKRFFREAMHRKAGVSRGRFALGFGFRVEGLLGV